MDQPVKGPSQVPAGLKRTFSFLSTGVLLLTVVFVISEFRLDWYEQLIGSYLACTNDSRPETGAVWETGQSRAAAHQYLDEVIARKEKVRIRAAEATSFPLLFSRLNFGEWVILDPETFKHMYRALPHPLARKIMGPAELVWLLKGGLVERIFCEKSEQGMDIYFIDSENRVMHWVALDPQMFVSGRLSPAVHAGRLEKIPEFSGKVYPVEKFFKAVRRLPEGMAADLIQDADRILDQAGTIERVGIWNQADSGFIRLGFEIRNRDKYHIVFVRAREWVVWQLGLSLKGRTQ